MYLFMIKDSQDLNDALLEKKSCLNIIVFDNGLNRFNDVGSATSEGCAFLPRQ